MTGTDHVIGLPTELDVASSFNVNAGGRLGISGAISGSSAATLTKTGLGTLELSGSNNYSGATTVSAGRLLVNGRLTDSAVTVRSGGLLGGSGTISGFVNVLSGGTWTAVKDSQRLEFTQSTGNLVIVPEPAAVALAGIGIAAAAWAIRRRRR